MALTQISTNGIKDATIATADIADDAVTADKLANSINTEITANTAKTTNATHTGEVTGSGALTIANDAVTSAKIADNAVVTAAINADAVTGAKIADDAIDSEHIADGSIDTAHIAADQITGAKIADDAIGSEHIEVLDSHLQLADSSIIKLGTGADAFIWHDGSDFYLRNYTGNIVIEAKSNEVGIKVIPDGAVELRYDNVKKLETASTGVQITGYLGFESTGKVIHLADSREVVFGTGEDLKIYHDGNNSKITDSGTGILAIGGSAVYIEGADHGETMAKFTDDGACEFYHDNSKKFETTGDGAKLTSGSHLDFHDSSYIRMGDGSDLKFYSDGSNGILEGGGTGANAPILINANTVRLQTQSGGEKYVDCQENGAVELYHNNAKKFETESWGATVTGSVIVSGDIKAQSDSGKIMSGAGDDLQIYHDGTHGYIKGVGAACGSIHIDQSEDADANIEIKAGQDVYLKTTDGAHTSIRCERGGKVYLYHNNSLKLFTQSWGAQCAGNFLPDGDNSHNLGASGERWANVYSADIHLNNTGAGGNEVDGSEGSWTIQEGANDLFLLNRTNGKKYKFNLTEIS